MTEAPERRRPEDPVVVSAAQVEAASLWLVRLRNRTAPAVSRRFRAWLAENPAHPEAFRQAEAVFGSLVEPVAQVGAMQQRRQGRSVFEPLAGRREPPFRAIAAAVAAMTFGVYAYRDLPTNLSADAWTQSGARESRRLADGSTVMLNTNSAARFDLQGLDRRVWLDRGQAWFDVARNPERPFLIQAGAVKVTVLGTAFDVRRQGQGAVVGVARGTVRVVSAGRTVTLSPGEEAVADDRGLRVRPVQIDSVALWRRGRAVFVRARLSDAVQDLGRYQAAPVLVLSREAGMRRLSAQVDTSDPREAIRTVAAAVGARVAVAPGGVTVVY